MGFDLNRQLAHTAIAMKKTPQKKQLAKGIVYLLLIILFIYWISSTVLSWLKGLDTSLSASLLTAFATITAATLTITLGRYFERVKESESQLMESKIEIYDSFLKEFFKLFKTIKTKDKEPEQENNSLAEFLYEWQRKMIVWGGNDALKKFVIWKNYISKNPQNAQAMFLMDDFFKAMRKDIGLSNRNLEKGFFVHFILRNSELFLSMAKEKPEITMEELSEIEKQLNLN